MKDVMINKTTDITIRAKVASIEEFLDKASTDTEIPVLFLINDMLCRGKIKFTQLEMLASKNDEVNLFSNFKFT